MNVKIKNSKTRRIPKSFVFVQTMNSPTTNYQMGQERKDVLQTIANSRHHKQLGKRTAVHYFDHDLEIWNSTKNTMITMYVRLVNKILGYLLERQVRESIFERTIVKKLNKNLFNSTAKSGQSY